MADFIEKIQNKSSEYTGGRLSELSRVQNFVHNLREFQ